MAERKLFIQPRSQCGGDGFIQRTMKPKRSVAENLAGYCVGDLQPNIFASDVNEDALDLVRVAGVIQSVLLEVGLTRSAE